MTSRYLPIIAWLLLLFVALATVVPIGLRPMTTFPPNVERFFAFGLVGFAFALAYPRHLVAIVLLMVVVAVGLELLQLVVSSRHGRWQDVVVKLGGAGLGVLAGTIANRLWHRVAEGRAG